MQKRLAHSKHEIAGRSLFLEQKDGFTMMVPHSQLKEMRCTGGKTKVICSGGKFRHLSEKVFYGGDKKFSCTACQWIGVDAVKIGEHIHHKMCELGG